METGNLFHAFDISSQGLSSQRARLNVIGANIANAQTTRTPEGGAFRRRIVRVSSTGGVGDTKLFEQLLNARRSLIGTMKRTSGAHLDGGAPLAPQNEPERLTVEVQIDDETPTRMEYDPGHPDANEDGYVEYPNVEIVREMVDLMAAARAYEANVTVLNSTKAMLRKALEI